MPYIPREHEKYDLLPYCREDGGEVFDYPGKLINEAEKCIEASLSLFPYNFESYEEYYGTIDKLILQHSDRPDAVAILTQLRNEVMKMNQKEEWSVVRYVGPADDNVLSLTHGKNYYWPTQKDNPVYCGVVDDEEFTSYMYPTDPDMWEILEDPTGMAYRTIHEKAKGHISRELHAHLMEQLKQATVEIEEGNDKV